MAIPMSRYVRIISSVTGASAVGQQKLTGRRFTTDPRCPVGAIVSVSPSGADDYFGASSDEAKFASQYFSYISPAPASQAPELQFAAWADVARPARIYGAKAEHTLAEFKAVASGKFSVTIGGADYNATAVNLSGASTFADVCTTVMSAVNGLISSGPEIVLAYDAVEDRFTLASDTNGPDALASLSAVGDDIGAMMGLQAAGAVNSPGADAQTALQAFQAAEQVTDSFGSVSFGQAVQLPDALEVANYVSAANVKYQAYWPVGAGVAATWSAAMIGTASQGLVLNGTAGEWKEALPMAVMAATDYDRTNAAINYMFRQSGVTLTADVTAEQDANTYDALRVNYYGQTATAGQNINFFQRGQLCGGATAPLDMSVHANEQWLKARLRSTLMALLLTVNRIPANLDGKAMVLAVVQGAVNQAIRNGTIIIGKSLTDLQKVAITQGSGDALAWHDVQNKGYWMSAQVTQETNNGVTDYVVKYTLFYAKGDAVRKIEGSHNLV